MQSTGRFSPRPGGAASGAGAVQGRVREVALSEHRLCVVTEHGRLHCGSVGVAGDGAHSPASIVLEPVEITGEVLGVALSDGHACAWTREGPLWCFGENDFGQLGTTGIATAATPVRVEGLSEIRGATVGDRHTCAWDGQGRLFCWGHNGECQLSGDPSRDPSRPQPVTVL
jgi:alpha-tubulin suppressor-like RCC1 family protein